MVSRRPDSNRRPAVYKSGSDLFSGVVSGNFLFISGQVPRRDGAWVTGPIEEQVACVLDNLEAILVAAGTSLASLCKVNAYRTRAEDFDGFNNAYRKRLGSGALPARVTGVTALVTPPDVRIEIDAVAEIHP